MARQDAMILAGRLGSFVPGSRKLAIEAFILFLAICAFRPGTSGESLEEGASTLPGLITQGTLNPRLPREFTRLRFSPDGNYILAQDISSIFVLTRQPLAERFRIDATAAGPAQFTPDSSEVVFSTGGFRLSVERWNVASGKRTSDKQVVLVGSCMESLLSPDGKTLACFSERDEKASGMARGDGPRWGIDLGLIDVATGAVVAAKKDFVSWADEGADFLFMAEKIGGVRDRNFTSVIPANFSSDGRYFTAAFNRQAVGVDLASKTVIPLHGDLEWILGGGFAFVSADRVLAENRLDPSKSEVLEFPSGLIISTIVLGDQKIEAATGGKYVILRPIKVAPVGVFDWQSHKVLAAIAESTGVDVYDKQMVVQLPDGEIAVAGVGDGKVESRLALPAGELGPLATSGVSPEVRWLALSTLARGAVWDLSSMQRHYALPAFRGAYFEGDDAFYADFPKVGVNPRSIVRVDLSGTSLKSSHPVGDAALEAAQFGRYLISKMPAGKNPAEFSLVVQDARDGRTLWTHSLPNGAPENIEVSSDQNRLVFGWMAEQKPAMDEIKKDKILKARYGKIARHMGAFLLQVLEADTGKTLGEVLVENELPETTESMVRRKLANSFSEFASGDWLFVIMGEQTLVYAVSTGDLEATVPGAGVNASSPAGLLAVQLNDRELQLYALPKAEKRSLLRFLSATRLVRFSEDGKRLFVLTQDQHFYIFDAAALARLAVAQRTQQRVRQAAVLAAAKGTR